MEITSINPFLPMTAVEAAPRPAELNRDVIAAVRALTGAEFLRQDRELSFMCERGTHRIILQVKDRKTGQVLEQIPPEQVRQILADLQERRRLEAES